MIYLESLDGHQSYRADLFCKDWKLLENGKIYNTEELGMYDWLRASSLHKSPQKKLKAIFY